VDGLYKEWLKIRKKEIKQQKKAAKNAPVNRSVELIEEAPIQRSTAM
jgi:hypothetical protein